jgi:hypothetical protein
MCMTLDKFPFAAYHPVVSLEWKIHSLALNSHISLRHINDLHKLLSPEFKQMYYVVDNRISVTPINEFSQSYILFINSRKIS